VTATPVASHWARKIAHAAAGIFIAASSITNISYGYGKGDSFVTALVWAMVAGAVAAVQALSWPAMIRSLDRQRWSAAVIALVALALSGTYSVVAALGSAAGGRANAATAEAATSDARAKAQATYDRAHTELDALAAAKPRGDLQAQIEAVRAELAKLPAARSVVELAALQKRGCQTGTALKGQLKTKCPEYSVETARAWERQRLTNKIAELTKDADRAEQRHGERRDRAQVTMDKASAELTALRPAKVASSDAKALARYLAAAGLEIGPDRLNDLLVLLAVLMIEAGGGLSLAIGMALSGPARAARAAPNAETVDQPEQPAPAVERPPAARLNALITAPERQPMPGARTLEIPVQAPSIAAPSVQMADVLALLHQCGGSIRTTTRRLGAQLGRPAATVHGELRRLASEGLITLNADRRGTCIALSRLN
jgi:hypothetical protein